MSVHFDGKRLAGTVNDTVEKFVWWKKGELNGWGKSKARIDTSAEQVFAELIVLNTHEKVSVGMLRSISKEKFICDFNDVNTTSPATPTLVADSLVQASRRKLTT